MKHWNLFEEIICVHNKVYAKMYFSSKSLKEKDYMFKRFKKFLNDTHTFLNPLNTLNIVKSALTSSYSPSAKECVRSIFAVGLFFGSCCRHFFTRSMPSTERFLGSAGVSPIPTLQK